MDHPLRAPSRRVKAPRHPRRPSARHIVLLLAGVVVLLSAPTASATDEDIATDASLAVAVHDAAGTALDGMLVRVTARRDGEELGAVSAPSDADGRAAFAGLPRALTGSEVTLDVSAHRAISWTDDDGCTHEESLLATEHGVVAAPDLTLDLVAHASSSVSCEVVWPEPTAPPPTVTPRPAAPRPTPRADPAPLPGAAVDPAAPGRRPALTPPPTDASLGAGPDHPTRPGWGWVVLGLICFAVVLGLAWPDHRDGG